MAAARKYTSAAVLLTCALLIPVAMMVFVKFADPLFDAMGVAGKVLAIAVSVVGCVAALILTVLHWKRLDEPAREAHKWAWFWGGSTGFALGAIAVSLMLAVPGAGAWFEQLVAASAERARGKVPATSFAAFYAIMTLAIATLVCHVTAWLYWWSKRRAA